MADKTSTTTVHLGENSPEQVALKLTEVVARLEKRELYVTSETRNPADRKWLLDTFAECLEAVRGSRRWDL